MADEGFTSYKVDPGQAFINNLKLAKGLVGDLTIPLNSIARDFFKTNKSIFELKGPGKYAPLGGLHASKTVPGAPYTYRQRAEARKRRTFGFDYPLLMATGRLMASLTPPPSADSVAEIINQSTLVVGTTVPYAGHLQYGTKYMKPRPFVFFGPESQEFGNDKTFATRTKRWSDILRQYVLAKSRIFASAGDFPIGGE